MKSFPAIAVVVLTFLLTGCSDNPGERKAGPARTVVASDTILSDIVASLLPADRYSVGAILPPGQCPGHYDIKLSDIEKMRKAELVVSFAGMPYMRKAGPAGGTELIIEAKGRNWMAPDSYIYGLEVLADRLSEIFPEDKGVIMKRRAEAAARVMSASGALREKVVRAGVAGKAVVASSMLKEALEWMGLRVVAQYGRPEAMSAREIVRLSKTGRALRAALVVDNLQSGPDAGKGIAETLGVPHVVLTNFPLEKGYVATLEGNVDAVLAALSK